MKRLFSLFFQTFVAYGFLGAGGWALWLGMDRLDSTDPPVLRWGNGSLETAGGSPLVVIDAGHGGHDGGAVANDLVEKNTALDIAQRVRDGLLASGIQVRMTRENDTFLALEDRAAIANDTQAAAFVSIHLNTAVADDAGASGVETYFCGGKSLPTLKLIRVRGGIPANVGLQDLRGEKLAEVIQRMTCEHTGADDRGVKERNYTVVYRTACPSVLVECGFLTHAGEAAKLKKADYRERVAKGITEGICAFLHVQALDPQRGLVLNPPKTEKPAEELISGL